MSLPILAYGSTPKEAGTFTLYRSLRAGLLEAGFDLRCVAVGPSQAALWDEGFADEGCVLLGAQLGDLRAQAQCFAQWCEENPVQFVMPLNSPAIRAALPHLPAPIRLLPRCADSVEFGYRRALTCQERIASIVATTPRHVSDLTKRYGIPAEQVTLIPHGIRSEPFDLFAAPGATRRPGEPIRLAFLGRLEHRQKGVLLLPDILKRLERAKVNYRLSIAGQGEHEMKLQAALDQEGMGERAAFIGLLHPDQVPQFLTSHDVLLFPSHHEGFGFVLIEALMAGCVPVASRLVGVTDFSIRHDQTGVLCPVGDTAAFAEGVINLARDAGRLDRLEHGAREDARKRFTAEHLSLAYARLLKRWEQQPAPTYAPLPWSAFRPPTDLSERFGRQWLRKLKRQVMGVRAGLGPA